MIKNNSVLIDADCKIEGYLHHSIDVIDHTGADGLVQRFYQISVATKTPSPTYHDHFCTEWFLIENATLYICAYDGDFYVEHHAEYENETFPLKPLTQIEIHVNKRDFDIGYTVAEFAKSVIKNEFNINTDNLRIVNTAIPTSPFFQLMSEQG